MEAMTMIKERRSIRKFTEERIARKIIREIVEAATYSPSWANFQIARYTVLESKEKIAELAEKGMAEFKPNRKLVEGAPAVAVVSFVQGKSGAIPDKGYVTVKGDGWEMFDAGIACQTFSLAAHEKGLGSVILGIFDEEKVAEVIDLPGGEVVAAIIPLGYPVVPGKAGKRNTVEEVLRFL